MRGLRQRVGPQRFGDPGRLPLEHLEGRLRGDVTRTESRPAGGQDERGLLRELGDRLCDRVAFVGHDAPLDLVALLAEQPGEQVAALVLARPLGDAVGDGDDCCLHSFTFSSRRTSPISIPESTPFAMS